ncbi:MAG TPA: DUF115 domain-containing protein [Nitrospirae bacterium]|nr:photosystem I assembly protein Ycf3 [bacterium BMS3Abin06]HDH11418.1 DUF115 domain-containing protein [Nitrospirota bacterium]HDZ01428.1 DUF115 domain-containing protein [Nitrospirota bacterium]
MSIDNKHTFDFADLDEFIRLPEKKRFDRQDFSTNNTYQKNLEALGKHHPELVDTIESISVDESRIKILDSESGNPRIVYEREDGEKINIHSTDDPVACANRAIELLGKIEKEGIVVLFGFGLGYFVEELFNRFEKGHIVLVYEATPEVFKFAMQVKDFSVLFSSEKVKIILGENADNFSVIHSHHHLIVNGKFWVVEHKPSVKLNADAYGNFFKRLNEEKRVSDTGVATNIQRGKEFINAFFSNLHSIVRKPGVNGLKDVFKGCTAIVVSAGPSLDKNVHLLRKAKGKAVIIATGGALPTLLSSDIVPDLLVEIDPVSDNIEDKFQGIPALMNVPFICLAQYTPELVNIYPGPMFINSVSGNIAFEWLKGFWDEKGLIECFGGSVAHLAFAAAEFIGADVIGFVGQDLSYKDDRLHTIGYSDNMDRLLEEGVKKKQDNIIGGVHVRDIFDEEVLAIRQFLVFKSSFENRIKGTNRVVINATEFGLPIDGATNLRLVDFMDEYCDGQKEIDTFSVLSGLLNSNTDCRLDDLIEEVSAARKKFASIKKTSSQILKYTKRVKKLKGSENKDSQELHNILKKVGLLIEKVKHPLLNLLMGYNYGLELYLKKQEIQDIDEIEDKWEMLDKQLERGQIYYDEIVGAIRLFNKQLDKAITALQREKRVDSILNDGSIEETEKFYRAAIIYKRAGMATQAVRYLEKVVSSQESEVRSQKALIPLAEMYIKQFRFYEAKEILTEVRSQKSRITELREVCNKKIREWEERKLKMNKMLKEAEANYGSHLESGYFYFRIKNFEMAEKAYLKAVSNEEAGGREQGAGVAACYGLAHTYLAMDDPEKAVDAFEKAIEREPDNPVLYRDLGFLAFQNNNVSSAEIFFARAIELAPDAAELYKPLADLYMGIGEREKAVALYENALQANPANPVIQQDLAVLFKETIAETEGC